MLAKVRARVFIIVERDRPVTAHSGQASLEGETVSKVEELKAEIERLPDEEFAELSGWLAEKDWERWDKEIESDSNAGRLDFLIREAREGKAKGTLKDL